MKHESNGLTTKVQQKFDMVRIEVKQESNLTRITLVNKLYIKKIPSSYTTIGSNNL